MTQPIELPASLRGLEIISKETFFATLGCLNIHPSPQEPYCEKWGYRSDWRTPDGKVLGVTIGGTSFQERVYLATPDFPRKP